MTDRNYVTFCNDVEGLLTQTAASKGYNNTGTDGENQVYEFIRSVNGNDGHSIGEVIYKLLRWSRKGNPEDLLKACAWIFLIWKHQRNG